jgi:hypothetical protein
MIRWPVRIIFGIVLYQMIKEGVTMQEDSGFWFAAVMFLSTFLFGDGGKSKEEKTANNKEVKEEKEIGLFTKLAGATVAYNMSKQPTVTCNNPEIEILSVHRKRTRWEITYKKGSFTKKRHFSINTTSLSGGFNVKWSH